MFLMTSFRNLSIFYKISSYGVIFISIIVSAIIFMGFYSIANTSYIYTPTEMADLPTDSGCYYGYISLSSKSFPPLMGIMAGGYYFHNVSLPVLKTSLHPENNHRDVFIGYFAVFVTYTICGVLGYYGFTGSEFSSYYLTNSSI